MTQLHVVSIENSKIHFVCPSKILHDHCFYYLLGLTMVPRQTTNNAYAKSWRDKQRVHTMVFLTLANCWLLSVTYNVYCKRYLVSFNL